MEWINGILVLPVEEHDEDSGESEGLYLQLGAARVRLRRDDLEGRHFALLPEGFDPRTQTITISSK